MTDLAAFLLARIAEDYEVAWGGEPSPWREGAWDGKFDGPREVLGKHGDVTAVCYYGGTFGHVLRFDPSRVLADREANRRIVEGYDIPRGDDLERDETTPTPLWVLRELALPYADHPDYREEWKP